MMPLFRVWARLTYTASDHTKDAWVPITNPIELPLANFVANTVSLHTEVRVTKGED